MSDRPNILYIFTDQQCAAAMSCTGNRDVKTPNMDRIAAEGMRFEKAYCTFPLCTPARASMFTGLMPHQIGADDNNKGILPQFRSQELGCLLEKAGYECVYGGKWHISENLEGHGFRHICGLSDWDLANQCVNFLSQPRQQPFFLVASFDNPHNICEWSRNSPMPWGPIPDVPLDQCPSLPDNFSEAPDEPEVLLHEKETDPRTFRARRYTESNWRRYRYAYYRLVEMADREIGRILDALHSQGLKDNTLIIFSSDHGDGLGAHQWNQKWALYEESVRIPFLFAYPNHIPKGLVDRNHLVSNGLDLLPTLCDYAGATIPGSLPGLSLRPLLEGKKISWREDIVAGMRIRRSETLGRMVRTARHKYILYNWGNHREQLFDLENDPGEKNNLVGKPESAHLLEDHRRRLYEWIVKTDDPFTYHYCQPHAGHQIPGSEFTRRQVK